MNFISGSAKSDVPLTGHPARLSGAAGQSMD
jgi:hypothetical protein